MVYKGNMCRPNLPFVSMPADALWRGEVSPDLTSFFIWKNDMSNRGSSTPQTIFPLEKSCGCREWGRTDLPPPPLLTKEGLEEANLVVIAGPKGEAILKMP